MENSDNDMRQGGNVVLCRVYSHDIDAHAAVALLAEAGIPAIIDNETFSRIYPIGFNSVGGLRVMVLERDLPQAAQILDTYQPEE